MKDQLSFWDSFPELKKQLKNVNKVINHEIKKARGLVGEALVDAFSIEGKLLRPAMVLLFAEFNQKDKTELQRLINIAASVEMLHNATLIHDDIIDESDLRRGHASIQAKYGKKVAVYAGDYLFALCFKMLSDNSRSMKSLQYDGYIMQGILGGELGQLDRSYNTEITQKQYLEQINGKTGLLFGLSCFLGSYEGGRGILISRKASQFGELLGQSFQIKDDILDYVTTSTNLHKPVLQDVRNGIYSGPMIFALAKAPDATFKNLVKKGKDLSDDELRSIEQTVVNLGGVTHAEELADKLNNQGLKILDKKFNDLETLPHIKNLSQFLLKRSY